MKSLIVGCFILVFGAQAFADVELVKAKSTVAKAAELNAFQNLDERLADLENYSVTYVEADNSKTVLREAPPVAQRNTANEVHVKLVRGKKRKLS